MKLFGSLRELVSLVFRKDTKEVTLGVGNQGGTASSRVFNLPSVVTSVNFTRELLAKDLGQITNDDINAAAGIVDTKLATIFSSGKVANSATTATSNDTASTIVARDSSGNFAAGTITASLNGNASTATSATSATSFTGSLSGEVTGTQSATVVADDVIDNANIKSTAGIVDTKLATISTAGKVSGSAITSGTIGGSTSLNSTGTVSVSQGTILNNSSNPALQVTQTGAGAALLIEDSTSPDSTPFVVAADGKVGIGTSSPSAKLQITGASPTTNTTTDFVRYGDGTKNGAISLTGPTYSYAGVGGNELWISNTSNVSAVTLGSDGAVPVKFVSNGSERMRIDTAGNVGIGTGSPSTTLDVAGAATISGTSGNGFVALAEQSSAPGTPSSGFVSVYPKGDKKLYLKDSTGTETQIGTVGIVVPGTSSGLVSASGLPGNTTGNAIATNYVGEALGSNTTGTGGYIVTTNTTTLPGTGVTTLCSVTLNKGVYLCTFTASSWGSDHRLAAGVNIGGTNVIGVRAQNAVFGSYDALWSTSCPVVITADSTTVTIIGYYAGTVPTNAAHRIGAIRIA